MPGTIQVSVLEFMALQSFSSPPLLPMSIKVSMGKNEFQTRDKGDFSFPLTTLRDKLTVILQDAEGEEVSRTVVDTRLVIERGIWDDVFPLEGGGHVHLKLQFVLSEEDRHRIRVMRESALRKKHEELLKGEPRSPPLAPSIADSQKILLENEVLQAGLGSTTLSNPLKNEESYNVDKEETSAVQKKAKTNDADRYEDSSSSSHVSHGFDVRLEGVIHSKSVEKNPIQTAAELQEDGANGLERQSTMEKTPSKISNMISAFESSLNQDTRPNRRPAMIKPLSDKIRVEVSSSTHTNEVEEENAELALISGRVGNAARTKDLRLFTSQIRKGEAQVGILAKGKEADLMEKVTVKHKVETRETKTSSEDFARSPTSESATVSGRMPGEKILHPSSNLLGRRRISGGKILEQKSGKGNQPNDTEQANHQGLSAEEQNSSECNGAWIFPDGGKRLCTTASGKQIMDLMGGLCAEAINQLGKLSSPVADIVKQVKEEGEISRRYNEAKTENSEDAGTRRGPIGQVMRVVIMVGFATLVLFTRKRKPGK